MTTPSLDVTRADPFSAAMRASSAAMLMTDPHRSDNPIMFANDAFLRMTGYALSEVIGRNCRFLQGAQTDRAAIDKIRRAIADVVDIDIDVVNYRKDGSAFHNALRLSPVLDHSGELRFFFALQVDVTERYHLAGEWERANQALSDALATSTTLVHEIDHRVKNNLQMVSAMILLQSLDQLDPDLRQSLMQTLARVEALSTVHRRFHQSPDVSRFDVAEYVRDLLADLLGATGRGDIRLELDLTPIVVTAGKSAAVALLFNEVFTNALKHAFPPGVAGTLRVSMIPERGHIVAVVEDNGVGMPPVPSGSFGQSLIATLARQLNADVSVRAGSPSGTRVEIRLPEAMMITPF